MKKKFFIRKKICNKYGFIILKENRIKINLCFFRFFKKCHFAFPFCLKFAVLAFVYKYFPEKKYILFFISKDLLN